MSAALRIQAWAFLAAFAIASPLFAQTPRTASLKVTVVDPSGAVIPNATVIVTGAEDATMAARPMPAQTTNLGVAIISGLTPGRYAIEGSFPGFQTRKLPDIRLRAGDNNQVLLLQIEGLESSVTVQQDQQASAASTSFGTTLTREQLDALSDDPNVLQQQLQEMAGPGAVIKIDSFEGGALPPKAMIRSIRISRDQFAAENHNAGGVSIEIITQPGIGPVQVQTFALMRSDPLTGNSPFVDVRGPEQFRLFGIGLNGSLVRDKASFNLFMQGNNQYVTPNINIALANGHRSEALPIRTPRNNVLVNGQLDYAITLDQTLRIGYVLNQFDNRNLGIGAYDEEERAFSRSSATNILRLQHMGPIGRRMFMRNRLLLTFVDSSAHSAVEAPTTLVIDAFTSGGAQVAGGQHTRTATLTSDFDYIRGRHSMRAGYTTDILHVRANDTSNYLGTYTFESLDAFAAGTPRAYTRRIGDPNIGYWNVQGGVYAQDDIRIRRSVTLSAGLRYELQTHVRDANNVAPRVGFTWAPFKSGRTAVRSSWGMFYDWLPATTYEQTLRVDGVHQQEVSVFDPSYPTPPDFSAATPANRYFLAPGLRVPRMDRFSVGVDQRVWKQLQTSFAFSDLRGSALMRGLNLNAPVAGVRPDPAFANIVEVMSDAKSQEKNLQVNVTANPGALFPAFNAPRIKWTRTTLFANYTLSRIQNNSDGPFAIPATGSLANEWGAAPNDVRHRLNVTVNNQIIRNFLVSLGVNMVSGLPYTVLTGSDGNGDLIFNDRPAGVGRGTLRMGGQFSLNGNIGYIFTFGRARTTLPGGGVGVVSGGGAPVIRAFDQNAPRYRLQIFLGLQNLTNRANYAGYSGTLTSRFFGQPTTVGPTRKVDAGFSLSF